MNYHKASGLSHVMKAKDFKKFLRGKGLDKLLHRARKNSQQRILANEGEFVTPSKKTHFSRRAAGADSEP